MISNTSEYSRGIEDSISYTTGNRGTVVKRKRVIEPDEEGDGVHGEIRVRPPPVPESRGEETVANGDSGGFYDDDEDEAYPNDPPRIGCQVLPVADLPEDFAGEPQDGMQYLFTVRRDAAALPNVTKVPNPSGELQPIRPPSPPAPALNNVSNSAVPSQRWRETFEKRFTDLRDAIATAEASSGVKPVIELPRAKDRDGWWKYINGDLKLGALPFQRSGQNLQGTESDDPTQAEHSKMNSDEIDIDIDDAIEESDEELSEAADSGDLDETGIVVQTAGIVDDELDQASDAPPSASTDASPTLPENDRPSAEPDSALEPSPGYTPKPPTAMIIAQLDNRSTLLLLMFFGYWLNTRLEKNPCLHNGTSKQPVLCDNDSKWIFSLLARLDRELTSEQISTLRVLARACIELLVGSLSGKRKGKSSEINGLGDGRAGCWMMIAAISKGWGQLDLWDEAVTAVAAVCSSLPLLFLYSTTRSMSSTFSGAHRLYVKSLYKRFLVNELNWAIRRDAWRPRAVAIRAEFERNSPISHVRTETADTWNPFSVRNVKDPRALAEIFAKAEAQLADKLHPDPYIPAMMPGGTKWERNRPPPTSPIFDHEAEEHH
ncbi:hypothetical protein FRC01_010534 [Tulasnella sp. 417]|nr:hypothetical protein FRC01_010534 [Tulasnella sp. 417]